MSEILSGHYNMWNPPKWFFLLASVLLGLASEADRVEVLLFKSAHYTLVNSPEAFYWEFALVHCDSWSHIIFFFLFFFAVLKIKLWPSFEFRVRELSMLSSIMKKSKSLTESNSSFRRKQMIRDIKVAAAFWCPAGPTWQPVTCSVCKQQHRHKMAPLEAMRLCCMEGGRLILLG